MQSSVRCPWSLWNSQYLVLSLLVGSDLIWDGHLRNFSCCTQCLKFPIYRLIYRRYIRYRSSSTRFLPSKIVQWKNKKKSKNIGEISPIYRSLTDISVNLSTLNDTCAWGKFLGIFSSIYLRYIGRCVCG